MKRQRKKYTYSGRDRISELPDEILHGILRRIQSPRDAAQTIAVSRRWRILWRSYPVVEFHQAYCRKRRGARVKNVAADFKKFSDAAINRFSRDKLLRMEKLKISLELAEGTVRSPVIEQLLDLASKRKAEEILVDIFIPYGTKPEVTLPFGLLSNSTAEILRLRGMVLNLNNCECDGLPLSMNSLRLLHLRCVVFKPDGILQDLISGSPLLETVELDSIWIRRKLQLSNLPNLKMLDIGSCLSFLEELYIAAPRLQILRIRVACRVSKIELIAPQLNVLEIRTSNLSSDKIALMISKLECLKFLSLDDFHQFSNEKRLEFSSSSLEEFKLWAHPRLEEIEVDARPCFTKFLLYCHEFSPDKLKKCEIRNASAACQWEVDFSMRFLRHAEDTHSWFVGFESFIASFTQFQTVSLLCDKRVTFRSEDVDHTKHPHAIKYLKINTRILTRADQIALLDGLFWACHPKFVSIHHDDNMCLNDSVCSKILFDVFMSQHSSEPSANGEELNKHSNWRHQLKNVKIISGNVNQKEEEEEEEVVDVSENVASYLKNPNQVSFMLTWY